MLFAIESVLESFTNFLRGFFATFGCCLVIFQSIRFYRTRVEFDIVKLFNLLSQLEVFLRPFRVVRLEAQRIDAASMNGADRSQMRRNCAAGRRHKRQCRVVCSRQSHTLFLGVLVGDVTIHPVATRVRHPTLFGAHWSSKLSHLLVEDFQLPTHFSPNPLNSTGLLIQC